MKFFPEDTVFDPTCVDMSLLHDTMIFFYSLYDFYGHVAILQDKDDARKKASMAYAIAETLKAVLALSIDGEQKVFDSILNRLCPFHSETKTTVYEFTAAK